MRSPSFGSTATNSKSTRCASGATVPSSAGETTKSPAAPSVKGLELPAVSVPEGERSKAAGSPASFSSDVSSRISVSLATPSTGISCGAIFARAAAAFWCEPRANRSWRPRAILNSLTMSSQCSPMVSPVEYSLAEGGTGRSFGNARKKVPSFVRAGALPASSLKKRDASSVSTGRVAEKDSTPPTSETEGSSGKAW